MERHITINYIMEQTVGFRNPGLPHERALGGPFQITKTCRSTRYLVNTKSYGDVK